MDNLIELGRLIGVGECAFGKKGSFDSASIEDVLAEGPCQLTTQRARPNDHIFADGIPRNQNSPPALEEGRYRRLTCTNGTSDADYR